jgi:hypothetical protein
MSRRGPPPNGDAGVLDGIGKVPVGLVLLVLVALALPGLLAGLGLAFVLRPAKLRWTFAALARPVLALTALGGRLRIESADRAGTVVAAGLPLSTGWPRGSEGR